ncbi:MAG: hypothetical protein AB7F19_03220 [Candidatus Babeliales bacterium]
MKKLYSTLFIVLLIYSTHALDYKHIIVDTEVFYRIQSHNCYATRIYDRDGNQYIVKQYKHGEFSLMAATTICELVALDLGHAVGVLLNEACLIPSGVPFMAKEFNSLPATVHTFVEGVRYDKYQGNVYKNIVLYQSPNVGLTREIIKSMACHKNLPALVALDTFVGNIDRGSYNYFYNVETNSFIGIDLGGAFSCNLCKASVHTLEALLQNDQIYFTVDEKEALAHYYATLEKLVALFPAHKINQLLDDYAQESQLFDTRFFSNKVQKKWKRFLHRCKQHIQNSGESALLLLDVISQLLDK